MLTANLNGVIRDRIHRSILSVGTKVGPRIACAYNLTPLILTHTFWLLQNPNLHTLESSTERCYLFVYDCIRSMLNFFWLTSKVQSQRFKRSGHINIHRYRSRLLSLSSQLWCNAVDNLPRGMISTWSYDAASSHLNFLKPSSDYGWTLKRRLSPFLDPACWTP